MLFEIFPYGEAKTVLVMYHVCNSLRKKVQDHPEYLRTYLNESYQLKLNPDLNE